MNSVAVKTKPADNKAPPADSKAKPIREQSQLAGAVPDGDRKQSLKGGSKPSIKPRHLTLLGEKYDEVSDKIQYAADELYKAVDNQLCIDSNQSKQQTIEAKEYADHDDIIHDKGKNVPTWIAHIRKGVCPNGFGGTDANRAGSSYIGQWLPVAIGLHYNMADPRISTSFAYFCMALANGKMGARDTGGTTMGNFQGEWREGAFYDYSSNTKGPLAK